MTKKFIFSLVYSLLLVSSTAAHDFVSLSPALTEIIYALGAQDNLKAVSSTCTCPKEAKRKPIIGDTYYINEELLAKIKPDYILAPDSSEFMLNKYKRLNIKPICYKYKNIEEIYQNIINLGKLTNKEAKAEEIVKDIKIKIQNARLSNKEPHKKILYIIQEKPLMTIGKNSFITDAIEKSGNKSITADIDSYYPIIQEEYAIKKAPDIVIMGHYSNNTQRIKKLFPNSKIIVLTHEQSDIIDRPSVRIYESVAFFANLQ